MPKVIVSSKGACFDAPYLENAKYDMVTLLVIGVIRVGTCHVFSCMHLSIYGLLMINYLIDYHGTTTLIPIVGSIILLV